VFSECSRRSAVELLFWFCSRVGFGFGFVFLCCFAGYLPSHGGVRFVNAAAAAKTSMVRGAVK
jgi:hypothetical protein